MERIDIQAMKRLQVDHRTTLEAKRAAYRQQIERLRRGEDPFPERTHQRHPVEFEGAAGGYRPHITTYREPLRPNFDGDPFPRELIAEPSVIERLTGHRP